MVGESKDDPYRWFNVPRWYLWEGGFLLIGRAQGIVPPHSHHAIQIVIALDGTLAICSPNEEWRESLWAPTLCTHSMPGAPSAQCCS